MYKFIKKRTKHILVIIILLSLSLISTPPSYASATQCVVDKTVGSGVFEGIESCQQCGTCTLCNFLELFTNLARWILSVMGGLALIYFIWGGVYFIMSLGNSDKISTAKGIITSAVIGVIIILSAWTLVNVTFIVFTGNTEGKVWGDTPWATLKGMCNNNNSNSSSNSSKSNK